MEFVCGGVVIRGIRERRFAAKNTPTHARTPARNTCTRAHTQATFFLQIIVGQQLTYLTYKCLYTNKKGDWG